MGPRRRAATGITLCACGEKIIRALLDGAIITLDRTPDAQGLVAATQDALGTWRARRHTPGAQLDVTEHQYAMHSCGAETAQEPPAGVAQIDAWREGVSGHRAQQRTARGRTRQPGVTGVRWRPR